MLKGIDISNYQKHVNLDDIKDLFDFGIIKATDGWNYISPSLKEQFNKLIELNKLIGLYHFARPDIDNTPEFMRKEADHFVKTIEGIGHIEPDAILVLDYEIAVPNSVELIHAFMDRVVQLTGVTPFLYSFYSFLALKEMKEIVNKYPIWMAWFEKYNPDKGEMPETDIPWSIWQYTGNGKIGEYSPIDLNVSIMDIESWIAASAPRNTEIRPALKWCQDKNLLPANLTGREHITVDSLAELIYRMFK